MSWCEVCWIKKNSASYSLHWGRDQCGSFFHLHWSECLVHPEITWWSAASDQRHRQTVAFLCSRHLKGSESQSSYSKQSGGQAVLLFLSLFYFCCTLWLRASAAETLPVRLKTQGRNDENEAQILFLRITMYQQWNKSWVITWSVQTTQLGCLVLWFWRGTCWIWGTRKRKNERKIWLYDSVAKCLGRSPNQILFIKRQ